MLITGIVAFILSILTTTCAIVLVSLHKNKEPRNKVRFFVVRSELGNLVLILLDKFDETIIGFSNHFETRYGLNPEDFADMKPMERREVYINLEN